MIKSFISKWVGDFNKSAEIVGELIIDNNNISFCLFNDIEVFSNKFIGYYDMNCYEVYTHGIKNRDFKGYYYHVSKVIVHNNEYLEDNRDKINGIVSMSFEMPELFEWLNILAINFTFNEDEKIVLNALKIDPIILKESDPNIFIGYETNYPWAQWNNKVEMTLKNSPRIYVEYSKVVDDSKVVEDIYSIMQFFALLLGRISYIDDLRVKIEGRTSPIWIHLNNDFSYKTHRHINSEYRTNYKSISKDIQTYFEKWYKFSNDENYIFLKDAFFYSTGKNLITIEELFLTYCRFLEGYDTRKAKDEDNEDLLYGKLIEFLRTEEIKDGFSQIFSDIGARYKPKSVARSISRGFMTKVDLAGRLKRLDEKFLEIISRNNRYVIGTDDANTFILRIASTRNYYAHFKADNAGILSLKEMYETIDLLRAVILAILLSEMGMDIEQVKEILSKDPIYWSLFEQKMM